MANREKCCNSLFDGAKKTTSFFLYFVYMKDLFSDMATSCTVIRPQRLYFFKNRSVYKMASVFSFTSNVSLTELTMDTEHCCNLQRIKDVKKPFLTLLLKTYSGR